jgi:sterol carrier protein 2
MSTPSPRRRVFVVGVGMTKFERPGVKSWDYPEMGRLAIERALEDCGVPYAAIEQAAAGYVYGDSTCGQRVLYEVGLTGIPLFNVNNNCSTGSSALLLARQWIESGLNQCALAFGFEKMEKGALKLKWDDRVNPLDQHLGLMNDLFGLTGAPWACQLFANAGTEHMNKFGTKIEHFAKIAEKNRRHALNNPYSQIQQAISLESILKSKLVHPPMTAPMCCPVSEGAGAAVLCSEEFVVRWGLQNKAIEISGMAMATDFSSSFGDRSMIKAVGFDMTKQAANKALKEAGLSIEQIQVIELHDCFACNEALTYEALGLCPVGKCGEFIDKGDNTYGGKYVVNPSGGLISKGHPLGATGLAQCCELVWQLRGTADKRQVKGVNAALQHNLGLGGAAVVTVYTKPKSFTARVVNQQEIQQLNSIQVKKLSDFGIKTAKPVVAAAPKKNDSKEEQKSSTGLKSSAVLKAMASSFTEETVKKVNATYRFDITPDAGGSASLFFADLKNGSGKIESATSETKADCIIAMKDADFVNLMSGKINGQTAFMQGLLKVKGNIMLAQKLQYLQPKKAKL